MRTANHEKAILDYEEALRLFQKKEWSKAIHALEQVARDYPVEREVCDEACARNVVRGLAVGGRDAGPDADIPRLLLSVGGHGEHC